MSNPANTEPSTADTANGKSKTAKTKEAISFMSTAVPLLGVLGTAFVWGAANFYVGTVDIKPPEEYQEITVQVFDLKGGEKEFHTPHFLIEPGKYHLAVNVDKKGVQHVDTEVKLGATSNIKLAPPPKPVDAATESSKDGKEDKDGKKHWWQVWKKSNAEKSNAENSGAEKSGAEKSSADKSTSETSAPASSSSNTPEQAETK